MSMLGDLASEAVARGLGGRKGWVIHWVGEGGKGE